MKRVKRQIISVWHEPSDKSDRPYRIDITQYDQADDPLPAPHGKRLSEEEVVRLSKKMEQKRVRDHKNIKVRPFQAAMGWVLDRDLK